MNWEEVKLGDICDISIGRTPSRNHPEYWGGNNPWVSISDLQGHRYISKTKECITDIAVKECNCKVVSKGTLIYSFKLSIGKIAITERDIFTNEAIAALNIKNAARVELRFLYYAVQKINLTGIGDKAVKGLVLNKEKLNNLKLKLPPLAIQKKIADILDKANVLRIKDQELKDKYDELEKSIFYKMFGEPVRNEMGWEIMLFGDLINKIYAGTSISGEDRDLNNGEVGVLKISAVTTGSFKPSEYKVPDQSKLPIDKIKVEAGDLIFSRANTRELVGAVAISENSFPNLMLPDKLWKIDLDKRKILPYFCKSILWDETIRFNLTKTATGTSGSMLNISMDKLKGIAIPVPPISLQQHFESVIKKIREEKLLVENIINSSNRLLNGLMDKYFK